jgi:hypothetical protein
MIAIIKRILLFFVPFTVVFWLVHWQFETVISRSTLNGLSGFFSAEGVIFGLIVAFVIQREWEMWINLSESVRAEIDAVREMWKWSVHAERKLCEEAHLHLEHYLKLIVAEWDADRVNIRNASVDAELDELRGILASMSLSAGNLSFPLQSAFTNLTQARDLRLNFSNEHMPSILKRIVIFADIMLIILSLFIAVNNLYLDYIFTAAISLLAFALILVVDDLDNPFRPGAWHLTTEGYEALLKELTKPAGEPNVST